MTSESGMVPSSTGWHQVPPIVPPCMALVTLVASSWWGPSAGGADSDEVDRLIAAGQVTLTVEERAGADRTNWPVCQGVAFAPGVLMEIDQLALRDADGNPVAMSARPVAWWDRERKAIRFAQVVFAADVSAGKKRDYVLSWHRGEAANRPAIPDPVEVEYEADTLIVRTGDFRVRFSTTKPSLWEEVQLGKHVLLDKAEAGTLFVTRQDGERFTMRAARGGYHLEIEESNPLRVVVKQKGVLASRDGSTTCCQYEIRHSIVAGQPWVHVQPRVIFTCDWPSEWLRGYGLELRTATPIRRATSSADGKPFWLNLDKVPAEVIQAEDNELFVRAAGQKTTKGKRGDGYLQTDGEQPLTLSVRDFWQQHPVGFVVDRNRITVKLWAEESGRELDFDRHWTTRTTVFLDRLPDVVVPNPKAPGGREFSEDGLRRELRKVPKGTWVNLRLGANPKGEVIHLDPRLLEKIAAEFKGHVEFFANDTFPLGGLHSPRGRAKSHDLLLAFGPTDSASLAAAWQLPLHAVAPPLYTCGTGALGRLRGREPGRFPDIDKVLLTAAELEITQAERQRRNGMLYHGSLLNWHNVPGFEFIYQIYATEPGFRAHERLGVCTAGSTMPGGGMQRGAWLMFAYTGEPRWLDFAQRVTTHLFDIDTCHLEYRPNGRSSLGYLAGEGLTPWSFWGNIIQSYVGMMHHYCFTGDPRALEAARLVSQWIMNEYDQTWDRAYETYVYDYTVRAWYIPAVSLLEYYWLTWDERALQTVNRMWERIQERKKKGLPLLLLPNHGDIFVCTLHELHPDPRVRAAAGDALLEAADELLKFYDDNPRQMSRTNLLEFRLLARAYELTGKAAYAETARNRMKRLPIEGLHGGWYGGHPPPSWPGMAAACIPWILPLLHQQDAQRSETLRNGGTPAIVAAQRLLLDFLPPPP